MTIMVMISLFIIAVLLAFFKYKKTSIIILFLTVLGCMLIGSGILPYLLLQPWQSSYVKQDEIKWAKHNAIVVLGGGIAKIPNTQQIQPFILANPRIVKGAQLYYTCKNSGSVCKLIVSGGDVHHLGQSEAAVYANVLRALNINTNDVVLESNSKNTYENAKFVQQILKKSSFEQIYLVTSGVHMNRALWSFAQFAMLPIPVISDYTMARFSIMPRAYNFVITDAVLHEYLGMFKYHIFNNKLSISNGEKLQ